MSIMAGQERQERMTFELWSLLVAAALGIVHLSAASFAFKAQVGNRYTVGPRDEGRQPIGVAGRLHRAQANFMETFPIFLVCVFIVHATHSGGDLSRWGCVLYLVGRCLFLPLYAFGVPWLRTLCWNAATLGLVLVGAAAVAKAA
jgi:uncharacterized MAPEG superfamily protein